MTRLRYYVGAVLLGAMVASIGRGIGMEPFDFWTLLVASALFYAVVAPNLERAV
jgi:hypothetical protein